MASVSTIRSLSGVKPGSGRISTTEDSAWPDVLVGCDGSVRSVAFVALAVSVGSVAEKSVAVESEPESECDDDGGWVAVRVRRKAGGC